MSSRGFFNNGVTTACFCADGSRPSRREALIIAVMYGSNTSTVSFSRNVGIGSSGHDFVGDVAISRRTSSSLHGLSVDSRASENELKDGDGRLEVAARTDFTFSSVSKKGVCVIGSWYNVVSSTLVAL